MESKPSAPDPTEHIYQCMECHMFETPSPEDEYVVVVLKVMNSELRKFYGGSYIVQQWRKKKKLVQIVHKCKYLTA